MAPGIFPHTRGVYALITTFLFIMVVLFSVLAMMYMSAKLTGMKANVDDHLVGYDDKIDAKNLLLSKTCYGSVINEVGNAANLGANETCDKLGGVIKGYTIEMLKYENCSNVTKVWEHRFSNEMGDIQPYFIPIRANGTGRICPGKLKVIR